MLGMQFIGRPTVILGVVLCVASVSYHSNRCVVQCNSRELDAFVLIDAVHERSKTSSYELQLAFTDCLLLFREAIRAPLPATLITYHHLRLARQEAERIRGHGDV